MEQGLAHHREGRLADAERLYREALRAEPGQPDALHFLGVVASQRGAAQEAIGLIARALALRPRDAAALNNLGNACRGAGRDAEAEAAYRNAIAVDPDFADALSNLGSLCQSQHRCAEASAFLRRALALAPGRAKVMNDLACALAELGEHAEAESLLRRALDADPAPPEAAVNLGQNLRDQGRLEEATAVLAASLERDPGNPDARNVLANVLRLLGRLEEAEAQYRLAVAGRPADAGMHSNLLFLLNYLPGHRAADIFAEHRAFGERFEGAPPPAPAPSDPDPERRLRVGYVSADFRDHPVAFFIEPVLERHDRRGFEAYCYYTQAREDGFTGRLRSFADAWRPSSELDAAALADLVRRDEIDVLVDLGGHTGHNRLLTFARRPAPVQVTWLGYLNTTGLASMDARITDAQASPPGLFDPLHTERLVRLSGCQWCYRPLAESPEVAPAPLLRRGHPTFGVFSNPAKFSAPILRLWAALLARLPSARLIVVGAMMAAVPDEFRRRFAACGLPPDRVSLLPARRFADYLAMHAEVDAMLDTYPYSGGTTTCHSLWMGVPIVTLAGDTATSRGGATLLHAVGLDALVAHSEEDYLRIAAALVADGAALQRMRETMRARLRGSTLLDEAGFTRNLEDAYRGLWRERCRRAG